MNLCVEGHDEVCYGDGNCPVCEKMAEIEGLDGNIMDLERKVESREEEIGELTKTIEDLEDRLRYAKEGAQE